MRVLLVANTLPPTDISGVGEQVLQLATGLRRAGHEVEVLGRGEDGARGSKLWFPLTVVTPFLRRLRRFRPHVVQVHESDGVLAALAAGVLRSTLHPAPLVVALLQVSYVEERRAVRPLVDGSRVLGRPGAVERRFRCFKAPLQIVLGRLTAWVSDLVLAPSRRTAGELERDYSLSGVGVLPNVTGGLAVAPVPSPTEEEERGYWLFVGRLRIRKGVEVLLDALRGLPEDGPPLWVAGDGEHRARLEALVGKWGLGERVRFLGRCDAATVRALLLGCRALVVPSTYEGMPLVVLEAMEAARPVVASAVSGIPEVVRDGVTGWLVPPEDPGALALALAEAAIDPEEARRRGLAGLRRLEERYRPRHAAAAWENAVVGRTHESDGGAE